MVNGFCRAICAIAVLLLHSVVNDLIFFFLHYFSSIHITCARLKSMLGCIHSEMLRISTMKPRLATNRVIDVEGRLAAHTSFTVYSQTTTVLLSSFKQYSGPSVFFIYGFNQTELIHNDAKIMCGVVQPCN